MNFITFDASTMNPITFHMATVSDIPVLVEYRLRFTLDLTGAQTEAAIKSLKQSLSDYFHKAAADGSCMSVVARCGNEVAGVGAVVLREQPGNFKNPSGKWGYIMNMYTAPEFRRRGVCTGILKLLVSAAETAGITAFELHATKAGEPVYLKEDFKLHSEPTLRKYIQ